MKQELRVNHVDESVIKMDTQNLVDFLYDYIRMEKNLRAYLDRADSSISNIKSKRTNAVRDLNSKFDEFKKNNLGLEYKKTALEMRKKRQSFFKYRNIKKRYYVLLAVILYFLIPWSLLFPMFSIYVEPGNRAWITSGFAIILYIFRGYVRDFFIYSFDKYEEQQIQAAKDRDWDNEKASGLDNYTAKDVFNYDQVYHEIDSGYEGLVARVNEWDQENYRALRNQWNQRRELIPPAFRELNILIYIYDQLINGVATSWKEVARYYQEDKQRAEIKQVLQEINQNVMQTNSELREIEQSIQQQTRTFDYMLERESARTDARIEGLIHSLDYGYYY